MKFIRFLQSIVTLMFVLLFSVMFIYMHSDENEAKYKKTYVEIEEGTIFEENNDVTEKNIVENNIVENTIENEEEKILESEYKPQSSNTTNKQLNITNKFYYSNLDEYSKLIYNGLEANRASLKTGTAEIIISNDFSEAIERSENIEKIFSAAVNAFEFDNPELFYLDSSKLLLYYEKSTFGNYKIYIKQGDEYGNYILSSFKNENGVNNAQSKLNSVVNEIINNANSKPDDYSKILYIHDWLVSNVKYNEELNKENKDNIYGAIVEGEAVCGGYSKAFKYLLDKVNINCIIIQGIGQNSETQENHAWNYVELNGKWYGVDCTWDDPVIVGDVTNYTEKVYYTYFLKGKNEIESDHMQFDTFYGTNIKIKYPELSNENY